MRILLGVCRIAIFLVLLVFALENTEALSVRFVFDTAWQAPLVVVLLCFFAGGAVLGVFSLLGTIFRLRREIASLKRIANPSTTSVGNSS